MLEGISDKDRGRVVDGVPTAGVEEASGLVNVCSASDTGSSVSGVCVEVTGSGGTSGGEVIMDD